MRPSPDGWMKTIAKEQAKVLAIAGGAAAGSAFTKIGAIAPSYFGRVNLAR